MEGVQDTLPKVLIGAFLSLAAAERYFGGKIVDGHVVALDRHERPFEGVPKLADVAGPVIGEDRPERTGRHTADQFSSFFGKWRDKMIGQKRQILPPLP